MKFKHIEGTGRPLKVVCPTKCTNVITHGKEYEVTGAWQKYRSTIGHSFTILKDTGKVAKCTEKRCSHINFNNWIVTEREQPNTGA